MARWTIHLLRRCPPEARLHIAAWLFWFTIALGLYCTFWVAEGGFQQILMAISWAAITITCVDIVVTSDVRSEVDSDD